MDAVVDAASWLAQQPSLRIECRSHERWRSGSGSSPPAGPPAGPWRPYQTVRTASAVFGGQVVTGPQRGAGTVGDAQPAEHVADVDLDRALADPQGPADLLVRHPLRQQPQHLLLAGAERVLATMGRGREQGAGHARVD